MLLQKILMPTGADNNIKVCQLYYHTHGDRMDFDGYFNLIYIEKRKKYTDIDNIHLKLNISGYSRIIIRHDTDDIIFIDIVAEKTQYDITLPYSEYDGGVFSFSLIRGRQGHAEKRYINGYYYCNDLNTVRDNIRLAVNICTYKREEYVISSVREILRQCEKSELKKEDVNIFVVDNADSLAEDKRMNSLLKKNPDSLLLIRSQNIGGSGGFARGLCAILDEKENRGFTHVLMMDDDASMSGDLIIRIIGILATLKEEWKNSTIGGSLLMEEYPYTLLCAGEEWRDGKIYNPIQRFDLSRYENAVSDELIKTGSEMKYYSGWWCTCYSLKTVIDDNLPLPFFIHYDDVEYNIREHNRRTIFFNGISVWHKGPDTAFIGANQYYNVRNNIIVMALHSKGGNVKIAKYVIHMLVSAYLRLNYEEVRLVYTAYRDFLKGPEYVFTLKQPESNTKIRSMSMQFQDIQEIRKELSKDEYRSVQEQIQSYSNEVRKHAGIREGRQMSLGKEDIKVIFPMEQIQSFKNCKRVLYFEPKSVKGCLRKKSEKHLGFMIGSVLGIMVCDYFKIAMTAKQYRQHFQDYTKKAFWKGLF